MLIRGPEADRQDTEYPLEAPLVKNRGCRCQLSAFSFRPHYSSHSFVMLFLAFMVEIVIIARSNVIFRQGVE